MKILLRHLRKAKMCHAQVRKFAIDRGFDWDDFVKNGIEEKEIKNIDNAMVKQLIAVARKDQ